MDCYIVMNIIDEADEFDVIKIDASDYRYVFKKEDIIDFTEEYDNIVSIFYNVKQFGEYIKKEKLYINTDRIIAIIKVVK